MNQLVLMGVDVFTILQVPILSTHSYSYRLVDQAMLDNCPEQLIP